MSIKNIQKTWYQHNPLAIMSYLSLYGGRDGLYGAKLAENLGLSQGSISMILRKLAASGIVHANPIGRTVSYSVSSDHPLLKALRIFENQLILEPLIATLKEKARQIILFGSCARGEDTIDSDIDLFILADEPDLIREKTRSYDSERKLNLVIVDPMEMTLMEETDKVFLAEIRRGIVVWESVNEDR